MKSVSENKNYSLSSPSDQNSVDIFKGEWSSEFPSKFNVIAGGPAGLFEDPRFYWAQDNGLSFERKRILELGPLEGAHTWLMEELGASEILAIEAHERSYLKCLITKELTGMKTSRFLFGDFEKYLENCESHFDICVASGVLYHSTQPLRLLYNISQITDTIFIWTHYFDEGVLDTQPSIKDRYLDPVQLREGSFECGGYPFLYEESAENDAFCGGTLDHSVWMKKDDITQFLEENGFTQFDYGFDHPEHANGPAIVILARR
tara:strand:+ start:7068 stop:7853 length:786 start_codon:yes stop_codon:yes gene_type:complete